MPLTLDQIEELRRGEQPSLSLQEAAHRAGVPFAQCKTCGGRGFTKATLLNSAKAMEVLTIACPDESPAISYERCADCRGAGGRVLP